LLGVDVGTTHCKAGLFAADGRAIGLSSRPTLTRRDPEGWSYFDPDELWQAIATVISEAAARAGWQRIAAIGIASMAETGLLIDRATGRPRSVLVPWFETAATPQAERLRRLDDPLQQFCKTGLRPNFKVSLAKILWLQEKDPAITKSAVWLSAADYVAYRLSGKMATDFSLAGRMYAFHLDRGEWDDDWLRQFGLSREAFPPVLRSGEPVGEVVVDLPGLERGIPVAITGHDHVCASFAAGAVHPGQTFDSIGTAESFNGPFEQRLLGEKEYRSGLTYGHHVLPGQFYWMGGLSASGGSVEWMRSILGDPPLSYIEVDSLLEKARSRPTGILYFPYLAGSGSPHSDPFVRGAFAGLSASHGRADLLKAVFEGTAYEMEFVRRAAEEVTGRQIDHFRVAGGGARSQAWMQIKADVSGCRLDLLSMPEAALLGAAMLAGVGSGFYHDHSEALSLLAHQEVETVLPDEDRHRIYRDYYEHGFLPLLEPLRSFGHWNRDR
jgi:xylulokinase